VLLLKWTVAKIVLIDGGFFVGKFAKHWSPKGRLQRAFRKLKRGKMRRDSFYKFCRKVVHQDLNYLTMRFTQMGCNPKDGSQVYLCYDGVQGRNDRGKVFSEYKGNRATDVEDYNAGTHVSHDLRSDLTNMGFDPMNIRKKWTCLYEDTKEADDLIAEMVDSADPKDEIFIFSADSDLYQLYYHQPNVRFHNFVMETDMAAMKAKSGVEWELYADWKALAGDTSDNIPGLRGIGPTTAAKLINDYGSLEHIPIENYQQWRVVDLASSSQVLLDWRADKDKTIEYCVRKFGVPWKRIEHQEETLLAPNQYQKLMEVLEEDHFEVTNVRHEILNYRSIIKLPIKPVVHYYSEEEMGNL